MFLLIVNSLTYSSTTLLYTFILRCLTSNRPPGPHSDLPAHPESQRHLLLRLRCRPRHLAPPTTPSLILAQLLQNPTNAAMIFSFFSPTVSPSPATQSLLLFLLLHLIVVQCRGEHHASRSFSEYGSSRKYGVVVELVVAAG